MGSTDIRFLLWQSGSMPGQKGIRLAKKGGGSSFPKAGFRRFQPCHPFPPASLCGEKAGGEGEGLIPALFVFGARPFARATRRPVRANNQGSKLIHITPHPPPQGGRVKEGVMSLYFIAVVLNGRRPGCLNRALF